jgi:hypothetical protein
MTQAAVQDAGGTPRGVPAGLLKNAARASKVIKWAGYANTAYGNFSNPYLSTGQKVGRTGASIGTGLAVTAGSQLMAGATFGAAAGPAGFVIGAGAGLAWGVLDAKFGVSKRIGDAAASTAEAVADTADDVADTIGDGVGALKSGLGKIF